MISPSTLQIALEVKAAAEAAAEAKRKAEADKQNETKLQAEAFAANVADHLFPTDLEIKETVKASMPTYCRFTVHGVSVEISEENMYSSGYYTHVTNTKIAIYIDGRYSSENRRYFPKGKNGYNWEKIRAFALQRSADCAAEIKNKKATRERSEQRDIDARQTNLKLGLTRIAPYPYGKPGETYIVTVGSVLISTTDYGFRLVLPNLTLDQATALADYAVNTLKIGVN